MFNIYLVLKKDLITENVWHLFDCVYTNDLLMNDDLMIKKSLYDVKIKKKNFFKFFYFIFFLFIYSRTTYNVFQQIQSFAECVQCISVTLLMNHFNLIESSYSQLFKKLIKTWLSLRWTVMTFILLCQKTVIKFFFSYFSFLFFN